MTIRDIIDLLESQGEWVNRSRTRDRILFGDDQTEISKVITCWVATNKVIQYAVEHDIHFIISHEIHSISHLHHYLHLYIKHKKKKKHY